MSFDGEIEVVSRTLDCTYSFNGPEVTVHIMLADGSNDYYFVFTKETDGSVKGAIHYSGKKDELVLASRNECDDAIAGKEMVLST